jgi:hypothetical protein
VVDSESRVEAATKSGRVVAPTSERFQVDPVRAGGRAFADHDVEHEVLHGPVEDLLDRRGKPVDRR